MEQQNWKLHGIRAALWAGIIADAVAAVLMLVPDRFAQLYGLGLIPSPAFGMGLLAGFPLMAGWTALLIWADRKPIERRGVLLLTSLIVIPGFVAVEGWYILSGAGSLQGMEPLFLLQAALIVWYVHSYFEAGRIEAGGVCCNG
jgi:hypothetical protein